MICSLIFPSLSSCYRIITNLENSQAIPGLRLSEHQIGLKIARWLKCAPPKIGKDDQDEEELSGDD